MNGFLLKTKGIYFRWIVLLILLAIPLTQIITQLHSKIIKESGVFGTKQAKPIEQKTSLGRILNAIDMKKDISDPYETNAIFSH